MNRRNLLRRNLLFVALVVYGSLLLGCNGQKISSDEAVGDYEFHTDSSTLPTGGYCFFLQPNGKYGLGMAGLSLVRKRINLPLEPGDWTIREGHIISIGGVDLPIEKSGDLVRIVINREYGEHCDLAGKAHATAPQKSASPLTEIVPALTRTDLRVSFDVVKSSGQAGGINQVVFLQPPDQLFTSRGGASPELLTSELWDQYFSNKILILPSPMTSVRLREGVANNQKDTAILVTELLCKQDVPVTVRVSPKEGEVDTYGHPPPATLVSACEFFSKVDKTNGSVHTMEPQ